MAGDRRTIKHIHIKMEWYEREIGDIKKARKDAGYTLREVEEITGISNPYLSQMETGKIKKVSFIVVQKLYKLLGESIFKQ